MSRRPPAPAPRRRPPAAHASGAARVAASRGRPAPTPPPAPPRSQSSSSARTPPGAPQRTAPQARARARSQVVSARSAARFAARARARRRLSLRPLLATAGGLVLLALAGWLVLGSPLLAAREVSVLGTERLDPAAVRQAVGDVEGRPLARVRTGAVAEAVGRLPLVKDVEVVRAWPGTLEVRVVERVPVAAVPAPAGGVRLVDGEGVVVADEAVPPPDVPLVQVDVAVAGAASLRATTDVLAALPEQLRAEVESTGAASPDDVRMRLRGGPEVVWGSASESALKVQVLEVLRRQPAQVYDVSAPLAPVTR